VGLRVTRGEGEGVREMVRGKGERGPACGVAVPVGHIVLVRGLLSCAARGRGLASRHHLRHTDAVVTPVRPRRPGWPRRRRRGRRIERRR
jgi:hypothetical protein